MVKRRKSNDDTFKNNQTDETNNASGLALFKESPLYTFDRQFIKDKRTLIIGVDEAGRGPLAGPVVAAACILDYERPIVGINDSKKLSHKKREKLHEELIKNSVAYSVGIVDEKDIDKINILEATKRAMYLALTQITQKFDFILTDFIKLNLPAKLKSVKLRSFKKGDTKSACIAAASIIAKVERDRIMEKIDKEFPNYNFKANKGYPTKEHIKMINKYGICKYHRKTFKPVRNAFLNTVNLMLF